MSVLIRTLLLFVVLAAPALELRAQEPTQPSTDSTEPPVAQDTPDASDGQRIVDGRPPLYTVKRVLHPLSWLEGAFEPAFRSAEDGRIHNLLAIKPDTQKRSGVSFGVGGAGMGSGFGPRVTFFHKDLLGRGIDFEVPLVYTYSSYQVYQFNGSVPLARETFVNRLSFDFGSSYASRARDDFFGVGNESDRADERQFRSITREFSAGFTAKLNDQWTSSLHGAYRRVSVGNPTTNYSAQEHFDSASVPGLFGATLRSLVFSINHSNETRDNYAFKGGTDGLEFSFNQSPGSHQFEYWRYHFDTQHFFWLTDDGRKVIAFRGLVETNVATSRGEVPFFDMPILGESQPLRGFENLRFRDKSAAGVTLEYRYRIWPAMDWGLFIDEGQVAPQIGDLALDRFHIGYGARLFVWPKPNLPISFDYGRSRETWRFYVNFNTTF